MQETSAAFRRYLAMKFRTFVCAVAVIALAAGSQSVYAQSFELHPYAGGFFPGDWRDEFNLKREGIYGVKGAVFVSDNMQLEGNVGYINHFQFEFTDPRSRALIWEFAPTVNFYNTRFNKVVPYISVGAGGLTGLVGDPEDVDEDLFGSNVADISPVGGPALLMENGDTFFHFSYGGGVKGIRLWGPMGLRGEVRGRTMPNFHGNSVTWLETTGGVTFTWGDR
jgi:hypothetical protein